MGNFNSAHKITMGHEGGYANNKLDTGGETYKGIARVHNGQWKGWPVVDAVVKASKSVDQINAALAKDANLQADVLALYKRNYWDVNNLDQINDQQLAEKLYDMGVNMGTTKAAFILQEALNLTNVNGQAYPDIKVDGVIGPMTLNLANKHPWPKALLNVIKGLQGEHYINLMRRKSDQEAFARTWFSRV